MKPILIFAAVTCVLVSLLQAQTTPPADITITGEGAGNDFGWRAAPAGDVNGDGIQDVIVGAPSYDGIAGFAGRAYLFHGPFMAYPLPVAGSMIATEADVIIFGEQINDGFGGSVASAGDVNGDGVADVIVGADQLFNEGTGKAYVFYGPLSGSIQAANANAILIGQVAQDLFGVSVSGAGDFNGDGFADVIVGAWDNRGGGVRSGRGYTFFGRLTGTIPAADADFVVTGQASDQIGLSVASMDLNGDGLGDLILGAPQFSDQDPGYTAIYFGIREEASRIRLRPRNRPIVIPPEGGSFRCDVDVINESSVSRKIDIWVVLNGPGVQRTLVSFSRNLAPGARFHRTFTQAIPGSASAGTYTVVGNAGTFPRPEASDRFNFKKL